MPTTTITLTDRPPVEVDTDEWPQIAGAWHHDGEVEAQALHHYGLEVREHADGRRLVYGVYTTVFPGETDLRHGELLDEPADTTVGAIHRTAERIHAPQHLADECIASLPAERI
jgi:hypothetical protein